MTLTFIKLFLIVIIVWSILLLSVYSSNDTIMPAVNAQNSGEDVDSRYSKALDTVDQGRYEEAISYLDAIITVEPNNVDALTEKGDVLYDLERYQEAIGYYDKALAIDPNYVDALNNKANALASLTEDLKPAFYTDSGVSVKPSKI